MTCRSCGRPTFAGCGAHIEQVLGDVPTADRCRCDEEAAEARAARAPRPKRSWFSRS